MYIPYEIWLNSLYTFIIHIYILYILFDKSKWYILFQHNLLGLIESLIRAPENHIYLFSISVVFGAESKIKILMSIIYLTMVVYVNSLSQIMYLVE